MAIEFNTSALAASIRRSSNVPSPTSFTMCGWFKYVGTPTTDQYAAIMSILNDVGGATGEYVALYKRDSVANIGLLGDDAGTFQEVNSTFDLTANRWFFAALVGQGTGANDLIGYLADDISATLTVVTGQGRTFTPNRIAFGYDPFTVSDYFPGDAEAFKVWDRALSQAEIEVERWTMWAKFRNSLNTESPAFDSADTNGTANDLRDYSGNGNHWDLGEALRDIDNLTSSGTNIAPILRGAHPLRVDVVAATGPTINTDPTNQNGVVGGTANFSVTATTSGGTLTYQWQRSNDGTTFSDISGATSSSYTTPTIVRLDGGDWFRCNVTDNNGTTTSGRAMLFVTDIPASYSTLSGLLVGDANSGIGYGYVGGSPSSGGGGTTYNQSVSGALSFSGGLSRQTNLVRTGVLSFAGGVNKQLSRSLTGVLSFAGTVNKQLSRALAGVLSFSATLTQIRLFTVTISGALSFGGALNKQLSRSLSGTLSFAGGLSKQLQRALAGALSFAGDFTKQAQKTLSGTLTFSASLVANFTFLRSFTGALTFVGNLATLLIPGGPPPTGYFFRRMTQAFARIFTDKNRNEDS